MTFTYDGNDYTLPDGLEDITVEQYAGWTTLYGAGLDDAHAAATAIPDERERAIRLSLVNIDRLTKALSYYSTIPLEEVQQNIDIQQVLSYIGATELPVALYKRDVTIEASYVWGGDTWYLNAPAAEDLSDYASFLSLHDMAQKALQLRSGDWSAISVLLAGYLRLAGESFPHPASVVAVGSTREVLMRALPMSIALPFAYFITGAMDLFLLALESYIVP